MIVDFNCLRHTTGPCGVGVGAYQSPAHQQQRARADPKKSNEIGPLRALLKSRHARSARARARLPARHQPSGTRRAETNSPPSAIGSKGPAGALLAAAAATATPVPGAYTREGVCLSMTARTPLPPRRPRPTHRIKLAVETLHECLQPFLCLGPVSCTARRLGAARSCAAEPAHHAVPRRGTLTARRQPNERRGMPSCVCWGPRAQRSDAWGGGGGSRAHHVFNFPDGVQHRHIFAIPKLLCVPFRSSNRFAQQHSQKRPHTHKHTHTHAHKHHTQRAGGTVRRTCTRRQYARLTDPTAAISDSVCPR